MQNLYLYIHRCVTTSTAEVKQCMRRWYEYNEWRIGKGSGTNICNYLNVVFPSFHSENNDLKHFSNSFEDQ